MMKRCSRKRSSKNQKNTMLLFEFVLKNGCGLTYYVLDTETTGLKNAYIVQLSAQKYQIRQRVPHLIQKKTWYIRPPFLMNPEVIAIHGITNEFLADKPTEEEVIDEIETWLGPHPLLVGQNIGFDIGMMEDMYRRCGRTFQVRWKFDTLEMMRDLISPEEMYAFLQDRFAGDEEALRGHAAHLYQLQNAVMLYGLDQGLTFHNADGDVEATARLLRVFYSEYRKRTSSGTVQPQIERIFFYEGRNKTQKGVYADTSRGRIYFSTYYKDWRSMDMDLDEIDLDYVEDTILQECGGITMDQLEHMTKRRWDALWMS